MEQLYSMHHVWLNELRDYLKSRGDLYVGEVTYLNEFYVLPLKFSKLISAGVYIQCDKSLALTILSSMHTGPFNTKFDNANPNLFDSVAEFIIERAHRMYTNQLLDHDD